MAQGRLERSAFAGVVNGVERVGDLWLLLWRTFVAIVALRVPVNETVRQMSALGVASIPITLISLAFSGMVLALHTSNTLKQLGGEQFIGGLVAVSMAREAAPVLTAVVVAARVGSAIAAELGTMTVTEQVDALRSLGISPIHYLVAPRFLAAVLMLPVLTLFGNVSGMVGGYAISSLVAGVTGPTFWNSVQQQLSWTDLALGLAKTFVFGAIITLVSCNQGLTTRGGAAGVGRSTTAAVVISVVLVYVSNYFLAQLMFGAASIRFQ